MKRGFQCDNCSAFTTRIRDIFFCLRCEKEICESCFSDNKHCKECAKKTTKESREKLFKLDMA